jgi:hypothetical protein
VSTKLPDLVSVTPRSGNSSCRWRQGRGCGAEKNWRLKEKALDALTQEILNAHGGLDRWNAFSTLSAKLAQGGVLWHLKGHAGQLDETGVTVGLREEWASHSPFGPGRVSRFEPDRVAILDGEGHVLEESVNPRDSFAGHTLETPWSDLQLAYFAGCAMWTYFNTPFLLAERDVVTEPLGNWNEAGESWRRLRLTLPERIASHSTVQTLYVDDSGLIRRHDYDVEIAGNTPGAHYVESYVEVQGLKFPTKRRIFPRDPNGRSMSEPLVVSIDISEISLR